MIVLADHFRREHNRDHQEWLRQTAQRQQDRIERARKERMAEDDEADFFAAAVEFVRATSAQLEAFTIKLDHYDQATVAALMENERALELLQIQINDLLGRAYVMEDGRRVFRTRDGTQVFDEFGTEVSGEELDFELIPANAPVWEEFTPLMEQRMELQQERTQLLEYQEKLDAVREAVDDREICADELEQLDAELLEFMPEAVAAQLAEDMKPALQNAASTNGVDTASSTASPTRLADGPGPAFH